MITPDGSGVKGSNIFPAVEAPGKSLTLWISAFPYGPQDNLA